MVSVMRQPVVRNHGELAGGDRHDVVIEHLQTKAVQVDEIAREL
jgi:hypothetical protein